MSVFDTEWHKELAAARSEAVAWLEANDAVVFRRGSGRWDVRVCIEGTPVHGTGGSIVEAVADLRRNLGES